MTSTPSPSSPVGRENENRLDAGASPNPHGQSPAPAIDIVARLRDAASEEAHSSWLYPPVRPVSHASLIEAAADEIERLERENFALAANQCKAGYSGEHGDHMCHLLDAVRAAAEFIASEYGDAKSAALDGHPISREARPVWDALNNAIANATQSSQPGGEANPHSGATP